MVGLQKYILFVCLLICTLSGYGGCTPQWRIIGGEDALKQYPSVVSVQSGGIHICGGTLVSNNVVLTGAHCVFSYRHDSPDRLRQKGLVIVLSEYNLQQKSGEEKTLEVLIVHVHYRYTLPNAYLYGDDVALLTLNETVTPGPKVNFAHLPGQDEVLVHPGDHCHVVGWGSVSRGGADPHHILQKGALEVISNDKCGQTFPETTQNPANMCAGPGPNAVSGCKGDSGGPFFCVVHNREVLIGIISYGVIPCGKPDSPTVLTKIAHYRQWIDVFANARNR